MAIGLIVKMSMKSVTLTNGPIKMAGNLHLPKDFSKDGNYVGIVCVHPAGRVKEQTAGLYAAKLADEGFVALAFDASYQGESGGEPRQEEDPYARVEDIRAAVDYLTTLGFVDPQRISVPVAGLSTGAQREEQSRDLLRWRLRHQRGHDRPAHQGGRRRERD
jgi:fermentation-respiration switch protein FrsA (DUF1100 family)